MVELKRQPCGSCCECCELYKKKCKGCIETHGKPFYVKETGKDICPVFECVMKREIKHCGVCREFPCDIFLEWYDPKRGIVTMLRRAGLLALRRRLGDEKWVKWIKENKVKFGC